MNIGILSSLHDKNILKCIILDLLILQWKLGSLSSNDKHV
jgi:hypothetical protein